MASVSAGDDAESPVAVNVTPLVDIIFCLCVFFMISFRFQQQEGRFDAWLPQTKGLQPPNALIDLADELRVALFWDEAHRRTVPMLGFRRVQDVEELGRLLAEARDAAARLDKPDVTVAIDAEGRVPWQDVVDVVNTCRKNRIDKVEFVYGPPR